MSTRILVVEDQADNRRILRDLLSSVGYEATRRIKADPALRHIPIIAVTSYALSGDDAQAFAAGCDAYVAKPFSTRALLVKVRTYLPLQPS